MLKEKFRFDKAVIVWLILFVLSINVRAEENARFSAEVYAQRRAAVLELMPENSIAIFHAAALKTRSNDVEYEYRQANDLFYLTGIVDARTALLLLKNAEEVSGVSTREIVFVPKSNPRRAAVTGETITPEQVQEQLAIEVVRSYDTFGELAQQLLEGKELLYYAFPVEFLLESITGERYFISQKSKKWLRDKFTGLNVKSPKELIRPLRQIKSRAELARMQKAIDITCLAHLEAMRRSKPGIYEYQLEAAIEYVFKDRGSEYPAFPSIIGAGPNSTVLHYSTNRRKVEKHDMIVMDIGAEYHGYSADVTRTIPANGKFTKEQQEIYEIVLRAQNAAMEVIKPGLPFRDVHKTAKAVIEKAGYAKYFNHGTSHYLGLDTHDIGDRGPLQPGMVITVEPGIYIKEGAPVDKKYWNIGVRIEDDVLVTEDGYKLLSHKAPRTVSEIEKVMQKNSKWTNGVK